MNSLSWMLYASNVVSGIHDVASVAVLVALLASIPITIFVVILGVCADDKLAEDVRAMAIGKRLTKIVWPVIIIASLLHVIIPERKTVLLIAASETASTVATSTAGKEILDDTVEVIRAWLKEQKAK